MAKAKKAIPEGYTSITPMLTFDSGARQAIDWYKKALGAEELGCHYGPDGKVTHALIRIGNARIMMNDAMSGAKGPKALGGCPTTLWVYAEDSDAAWKRATADGVKIVMPLADQFWGDRCGAFVDPFGFTWWIATHKEDLTDKELEHRQTAFFEKMAGSARK